MMKCSKKKKKEEYDKMIALRSKPRHYSQQFEVSGKPEFEPWTSFADGGLTRTVAPDSGPMSQGLRSLYINDRDY